MLSSKQCMNGQTDVWYGVRNIIHSLHVLNFRVNYYVDSNLLFAYIDACYILKFISYMNNPHEVF